MRKTIFYAIGLLISFLSITQVFAQLSGQFQSEEISCGKEDVCEKKGSFYELKTYENSLSAGYGFGIFNYGLTNKIKGGHYEFYQVTLRHERPLYRGFYLLIDPYVSYIRNPVEGLDIAFGLSGRYYFNQEKKNSFFLDLGVGALYSTLQYKEQSNHEFFLIQGGIGYRWDRFFIENRLRHYSNGYTATKNWAIHSNIISVGFYF
ncbi:MAG: acyloxyacyl hydrolase [Syntrophorhabdaceae bacterium]|nr:acyloxyacyl hydrolase [Syntrophorhabdaceae bacterium]